MLFEGSYLGAQVATPQNGLAAAWLPAGLSMKMAVINRDATGEVEWHAEHEHFYIAQEGEAEVTLGREVKGYRGLCQSKCTTW
jgi:hypothetical protein